MDQNDINYASAVRELEQIVEDLKMELTSVDELTEKVKRAKFLMEWCQLKLRNTQKDLDKLLGTDSN